MIGRRARGRPGRRVAGKSRCCYCYVSRAPVRMRSVVSRWRDALVDGEIRPVDALELKPVPRLVDGRTHAQWRELDHRSSPSERVELHCTVFCPQLHLLAVPAALVAAGSRPPSQLSCSAVETICRRVSAAARRTRLPLASRVVFRRRRPHRQSRRRLCLAACRCRPGGRTRFSSCVRACPAHHYWPSDGATTRLSPPNRQHGRASEVADVDKSSGDWAFSFVRRVRGRLYRFPIALRRPSTLPCCLSPSRPHLLAVATATPVAPRSPPPRMMIAAVTSTDSPPRRQGPPNVCARHYCRPGRAEEPELSSSHRHGRPAWKASRRGARREFDAAGVVKPSRHLASAGTGRASGRHRARRIHRPPMMIGGRALGNMALGARLRLVFQCATRVFSSSLPSSRRGGLRME